uniref:NCK associated protein 5 n=1 Tax=Fundulus heteroclitus TaxID=8078 RepID=A0A3Q2U7X9_FUNHE
MHQNLPHLEEERRLRLESEKRLREVTEESELERAQMVSLQQQFSRMEETVRSLLQNQGGVLEQTAVDTVDIMKAYKVCGFIYRDARNHSDPSLCFSLITCSAEQLTEPGSKALIAYVAFCRQVENSALALENESQREQYERCLDEVSEPFVHHVLLTLKSPHDLREECLKLRTRVFDLEQQNRALSVLFQQRIKPASDLLLQSSLTWEKRLSLGSSAPSNICAPSEEQRPTRCKESHILEGLRKLQRRKHRSSSCSSKVSRSGYKDCMNSNEGIYSLGIKSSSKGVSKPSHCGRTSTARGKQFFYDSDDADDELAQSSCRDNIPTKDCWFHCKRLSHSISDSLCSWEGTQESGPGSDGEHKSAFSKPSKLHFSPPEPEGPKHLCDMDNHEQVNSECSDVRMSCDQPTEQVERDFKRLSRDAAKLLKQKYLGRDQGRTQSADGRPRPFSLKKEPEASMCTQSEESILAVFDAEGEPIDLCPQRLAAEADIIQGSKNINYAELVPQERPTRQISANARNYNVLESPENPVECETRASKSGNCREGSTERLSLQLTPQRKLIKPPSVRASKGQSIPPLNNAASHNSNGSKIPGRNKPSASPLRVSKGSAEPSNGGNSGSSTQEKSPSSPTIKMSRFLKTQTSSQSPKSVNSKLSNRADWSKGPSSTSPHLPRRLFEDGDTSEQPTRDKHCEPSKNKLRSPSPPPPPGRTTSLLVRPNYEGSPQAHKTGVTQPSTLTTGRGPPPSTSKRTKDYLPSATSGCAREPENAPRSSKNVPPPYSALRGSSLQNSFAIKKGPIPENVHQTVQKTSISLPISPHDSPQCQTEQQNGKAIVSPPSSAIMSPNQAEKASKTRIPMGFKAFLKSPPKSSPTIPGKQEKDHINSVSKETVTSNASTQCDGLQAVYSIDLPPNMSSTEGKGDVQCCMEGEEVHATVLPEEGDVYDKGKRSSQLFGRSISVTTKNHLKPALGMNGAKARSQSFSTNYMEKPNINLLEGPGKIRTQIITNSGERGNSLSRQSSLEVPAGGLAESPVHSPRTRVSYYGGMTGSTSTNGLPDKMSKSGSKGEGVTSPTHKEVRSLPTSERTSFNNILKPKVASHPQFQPQPSFFSSENPAREKDGLVSSPNEPVKTQLDSPIKSTDAEEKKASPTVCTIEEKVMMGIEENLQKSQEQEKVAASEAKQKTGPSLANWFGLRKSKLPALSGKKLDSPKGKEEKKDLKIGSVLGGKQIKPEKKKEKKKESQDVQNLSEMNNKLSSIMDHCNNQMGQIASQIQCTTAFIGKDQFVKDLLGRWVEKCFTSVLSFLLPPCCCCGHAPLPVPLGSSCQMRTLDSGIGTFPLPDSVTRASGRHIPKSEPGLDGVTAGPSDPDPSQPDVKVPSLPKTHTHAPGRSMAHSASEPTVTGSRNAQDTQSRLPKLSSSGQSSFRKRIALSVHVRWPQTVYLSRGNETETEPERTDATLASPQRTQRPDSGLLETLFPLTPPILCCSPEAKTILSITVEQTEETLKSRSVEKSLRPGADPSGSLSDSLYDSFSSCTSQGSNGV